MSLRNVFAVFFGFALALLLFAPVAKADEWNQMTKLRFSQPVQIPGEVLPAGTYWFVLANGSTDRNVVEIFNKNRTKEFATLSTVPTIRSHSTNYTQIKFAERPHDQPEALLKWYYPGRLTGHEFLYSARNERAFSHDIQQNSLARPLTTRS